MKTILLTLFTVFLLGCQGYYYTQGSTRTDVDCWKTDEYGKRVTYCNICTNNVCRQEKNSTVNLEDKHRHNHRHYH